MLKTIYTCDRCFITSEFALPQIALVANTSWEGHLCNHCLDKVLTILNAHIADGREIDIT